VNLPEHSLWTGVDCDPIRVLFVHHIGGDTFAIEENGDVSLSDGATLTLLLKQLSGREDP
jgi:hypothetical protein